MDVNTMEKMETIEQMEFCIDKFLKFYESPNALVRSMDDEQIKNIFKISSLIEKSIGSHENEVDLKHWTDVLETLIKKKELCPKFDIDFFTESCDYALGKFFLLSEVFANQIEIAVRIYTSLLPPKRFYSFLLNLLTESAAHQAIQDFIFENEDIEIKTLQYKLIIEDWIPEYEDGRTVELVDVIRNMMSSCNCEKTLHIVIGILAVETDSEEEKPIKDMVLKEVLDALCSRNKLSKNFWLSLFAVDRDVLLKACEFYEDFHVSLCKFLIYFGTMMYKSEGKWCPISTSICPELTYDFLVEIIRQLSNVQFSRRNTTIKMILKAEEDGWCTFWRELLDLM